MRRLLLASTTAAFMAAPALSQTALLREDDPAPNGVPGDTISFISNTAVNQTGGYVASFGISSPSGTISAFWGNLSGGAPTLLRQEGLVSTFEQTSIESFFGIGADEICYSPTSTSAAGVTGLDGVWVDDTVIWIEEMMIPGTSDFVSFGSRPGATQSGEPYWVGGRTSTQGGSTESRAIYFGTNLTPVYETGVVYPNMPLALSSSAVDFDFRFSANGTHNITPLDLDTGTADDGVMALDGSGLVLGGTLVREGEAIPVSVGGTGDSWDNFDFCGINENGDYFFTGDTDGPTGEDEFIARNGQIIYREGSMLDGEMLSGAIEGAFMNEAGELAFIWDIVDSTGEIEALFFEGSLLLKEGDAVDWDGDGVIDPANTITAFTGTSSLTMGADGAIYFTADVDVNGSILEGYFVIGGGDIGTNYCTAVANSTGLTGSIFASGSAVASVNDFTLTATDLPANQFGIFVTSSTQGFIPGVNGTSNGNLCLSGQIGRFVGPGQILNTGAGGSFTLVVDLASVPQGAGTVSVMAGDTRNFQAWHRDGVGLGSNLTDGLEVLFQ